MPGKALVLALGAGFLLAACGYPDPGTTAATGGAAGTDVATPTPSPTPSPSPGADDFNAGKGLPVVTLPDGLKYIDIKVGDGAQPKKGDTISVQYSGWLTNGTLFDSSRTSGTPASFQIGVGAVIPGWDEAVITMKVGGKRKLIIPPAEGYGSSPPQGGVIPANATLVFEVELLSTAPTPSPSPSPSPT
jgi:peptidylprolyl isomerase